LEVNISDYTCIFSVPALHDWNNKVISCGLSEQAL